MDMTVNTLVQEGLGTIVALILLLFALILIYKGAEDWIGNLAMPVEGMTG